MDVILLKIFFKKIKVFLVFFCVAYFTGCNKNNSVLNVDLKFKNEKVVGISFTTDTYVDQLAVFIKGNSTTPVLGNFRLNGNKYTFYPIVPFTTNQAYQIKNADTLLGEFVIAPPKLSSVPELKAISPSMDTVPENLLKMYFVFTEPMQEVGNILDFITVFDNTEGNPKNIFLALPSHLWNKEHTQLTLWLDPGRIKTNLIPNKREGLPIMKGHQYTLKIHQNLKSAKGIALGHPYSKNLFVGQRDNKKPNILQWSIKTPKKNTLEVLQIGFNEPMDAVLAKETFVIRNGNNTILNGNFVLKDNEQNLLFYPKEMWSSGVYKIEVLSILEDLAGNNLNHLFDNDLENDLEEEETSANTRTLKFVVK